MERKKPTRLELKNWKKLKILATKKETTIEDEVNRIVSENLESENSE